MGFFKKLFGIEKKEEIVEEPQEVVEKVYKPAHDEYKVNNKIIKIKCQYCKHKKARKKNDGTIVCRGCKSIIGRQV